MNLQILPDVNAFAKAEYDVARLKVIDKVSRLVGTLLLIICLILIAFAVLTFGAAAAVYALAQVVPMWASCLIIGAVYLLLIPILCLASTALFVNPIIRKLSGIKNEHELMYKTIRAEDEAAVQRERMRFVQTFWSILRSIFCKSNN